ncbi:hypothetical protein VTN77DRAFT_4785 [Rasamsonia byssochlamydoides]|uniref:uncharacterized protein n=1 Tax=Rasamsonia byssochlamydoides TaxID=89139 RepID=UPI0037424F53
MTFRDRIRRAFRRSSSNKENNNGKPKIEYYRRGEVPRSKYRGPVDPEHRRKLYAWNFADAMADRRRSFDLDLSPCTSIPEQAPSTDEEVTESEPEVERQRLSVPVPGGGSITVSHHEVAPSPSVATGSQSSTAVDPESYGSSLTLKESWDWPMTKKDALSSLKEAMRCTSPTRRRTSAPEKRLPFAPEDLSRALNAIQLCS